MALKSTTMYDSGVTPAQQGRFELGQTPGAATCLDFWTGSPDTVENAHDQGNRLIYEQPVNNNATQLTPAPEADR